MEKSLLWLKSKSISEAHRWWGSPSRGKRTGPFSADSVCCPHQLLQKTPCKTLVISCADPTKVQPLGISSEKVLDLKNECSQPHSTEQVSIFFSFIWTGIGHNMSLSLLNLSYTVTVFFISFFFNCWMILTTPFPPSLSQMLSALPSPPTHQLYFLFLDSCRFHPLWKMPSKSHKMFSSVQFSRSVMSDSLRSHELQNARPLSESSVASKSL